MTAIAVPIFVKPGVDLEDAIPEAEEALEGTHGIIELRCDKLPDTIEARSLAGQHRVKATRSPI